MKNLEKRFNTLADQGRRQAVKDREDRKRIKEQRKQEQRNATAFTF